MEKKAAIWEMPNLAKHSHMHYAVWMPPLCPQKKDAERQQSKLSPSSEGDTLGREPQPDQLGPLL